METKELIKEKWLVKHSESKEAYNVIGSVPGRKYKICRVPYLQLKDMAFFSEKEKTQAYIHAKLIASAPLMLEALMNLENDNNIIPIHAWELVQNAIKKATK